MKSELPPNWLKAKLAAKGIKPPRGRNAQPEAALQAQIVEYLTMALDPAKVFWSATMNGVKVGAGTRAKLKRQGLRPGVLDLVFVLLAPGFPPLGGHALTILPVGLTLWIELKVPPNDLSAEQETVMKALEDSDLGRVCTSLDEVVAALDYWGVPLKVRPS